MRLGVRALCEPWGRCRLRVVIVAGNDGRSELLQLERVDLKVLKQVEGAEGVRHVFQFINVSLLICIGVNHCRRRTLKTRSRDFSSVPEMPKTR